MPICRACAEVCSAKARVMSGKRMSVQEVMSVVDRDSLFYANSDGGVTLAVNRPLRATPRELLQHCASKGYHVCVDTCGMRPNSFGKC